MTVLHRWADCEMCGRMVICGKCGNNCCNGTYGEVDGVPCNACPEAYEMQDAGEQAEMKSRILQCAYRLHAAKHLSDAGLVELLEIVDGE